MVAQPALENDQNGHVPPLHPQPPAPPLAQPNPAPGPAPQNITERGFSWARTIEILLLLVTALGVAAGYWQYRQNTRNEKHKQFREILAELLGNQTAFLPSYATQDPKSIGDSGKLIMHYDKLVALEPDIEDKLSVTDCRQMAVFAAEVKGRSVAEKYLKKGQKKLDTDYDPVDAAHLYYAWALILLDDFPATSAEAIIGFNRLSVEHAEKIADETLRRAIVASMHFEWAVSYYTMGRFPEGDEQMESVKATHKFATMEIAISQAQLELKVRDLKFKYGQKPGKPCVEPMTIDTPERVRMADGTFQWRATPRPTKEIEREKKEREQKDEENRLLLRALKSLF